MKTYQKTKFALLFTIFAYGLNGCTKEYNASKSNEQIKKYKVEYYLDNFKVDKHDINLKNNDNYLAITKRIEANDTIIVVESFTTEEGFIEFGLTNNLKIQEIIEFENRINNYASENNTITTYETSGKVSKEYKDFENETFNNLIGSKSLEKTTSTVLHQNYLGGPDFVMTSTVPFLGGGWDNEVSAFTPIGLYGVTVLYDKSFYRKRMAVLWGWGFTRIQLYWGYLLVLNDNTSSAMSF